MDTNKIDYFCLQRFVMIGFYYLEGHFDPRVKSKPRGREDRYVNRFERFWCLNLISGFFFSFFFLTKKRHASFKNVCKIIRRIFNLTLKKVHVKKLY